MDEIKRESAEELNEIETREWLESLEFVLQNGGPERVKQLLNELGTYAHQAGVELPFTANTPYIMGRRIADGFVQQRLAVDRVRPGR